MEALPDKKPRYHRWYIKCWIQRSLFLKNMHSYSWWFFPHPFAKICVPSKWVNIFPNFRGENKKSLKPPTCSFNDETFQKILFKTFIHKFIERFFFWTNKNLYASFLPKIYSPNKSTPAKKNCHPTNRNSIHPLVPPTTNTACDLYNFAGPQRVKKDWCRRKDGKASPKPRRPPVSVEVARDVFVPPPHPPLLEQRNTRRKTKGYDFSGVYLPWIFVSGKADRFWCFIGLVKYEKWKQV